MKTFLKKLFTSSYFYFLLYFLIWFVLFRYTDSYTKGYNITEDYTVVLYTQEMNQNSLIETSINYVIKNMDSRARFAPVSDVFRLVLIKIFGTNFTLFTFFMSLLGVLSSFIFFLSFKKAGFNILLSFLFGILILSGKYVISWSDISNFEGYGMLFLSISFYFCINSSINQRNTDKLLFLFFMLLTTLSKENFILLTPALLLIYLKMYSIRNNVNLMYSFKKNFKFSFLILLIMILHLSFIKYFVGINKQGYAGVDFKKIGLNVIPGFVSELFKYSISYLLFAGIIIVLFYFVLYYKTNPVYVKKSLNQMIFAFILFILISFPQYIIHLKTGLMGRYSLIFCMGMNAFLLLILWTITDSKYINKYIKIFFVFISFAYAAFEIKTSSVTVLTDFSRFCKSNTAMINKLNTSTNKDLLIVMDPVSHYHFVYSMKMYLNYLDARKNYSYQFVKADNYTPYYRDTAVASDYTKRAFQEYKTFMLDSLSNNENVKEILLFGGLKEKFIDMNKFWFKEENFNHEKMGMYNLYSKK